jgi:NAD(P)-dependent dehydrogenase (short-subunit alcohol dehydrogenase family)
LPAARLGINSCHFGKPGDIFGAALLLASRAGAFITGQTIFVDGGRTCV